MSEELTYGHRKVLEMFPLERFYGFMWDEAREKVAVELDKTIRLDLKKRIPLNRAIGKLSGALIIIPYTHADSLAALIEECIRLIEEVLK